MPNRIYFDNSATTRPCPEVVAAMAETALDHYGNPSSLHSLGFEAEKALSGARETLASAIRASAREVYFTSGGTESNNIAILGGLKRNPRLGKKIITTAVEHLAVRNVFRAMEQEGYHAVYLPVDRAGRLDISLLEREVDENTALVSLMHVNNETGAIFPIREAVAAVRRKNPNTLFHTDAVQSFLKLPVDVKQLGVDFLSASAHKIHGPRGVGLLYVRKGVRVLPIQYGGGQMEDLRPGTENLPAIIGFQKAAELALPELPQAADAMRRVRQRLLDGILPLLPDITVNSPEDGAPGILNLSFCGVRSEVLLHALDAEGISVSSGSACSSHRPEKSHVLLAMDRSPREVDSALRLSFSRFNTEDEADAAAKIIVRLVTQLRKVMR